MKGGSSIINGIHHSKRAIEYFSDFIRSNPGSKGAMLLKQYNKRIEFVYNDMVTHPFLTLPVRQGIKNEWHSDVFAVDSINDKIALLTPDKREVLETLIECLLNGESIIVETKNPHR